MSFLVPEALPLPPFGVGFIRNPTTGLYDVDEQAPVASSTAPVAATALVDTTGHSFTLSQIAALNPGRAIH